MEMNFKQILCTGKGTYKPDRNRIIPGRIIKSRYEWFYLRDHDPLLIDDETEYEFTSIQRMDKRGGWRGTPINTAIPIAKFERIR